MAVEHANVTDPNIHEPKGASTATSGQAYIANGSGSGNWKATGTVQHGWYDYGDTATSTTPIALTAADTFYQLTNDGLGDYSSNTYAVSGVADVWDATTNTFDFSDLSLGDTVDLRIDIICTTSASNDSIELDLLFGEGTASEFTLPIVAERSYKTAGEHRLIQSQSFYLGDADVKDTPVKIRAMSDTTGDSIVVNGWFVRVFHNV